MSEAADAVHVAFTTPGKLGSFGGVHRPFVEHFGRREAERYLRTQEAYTLHKQVKKRFMCHKILSKGIADLYQADLINLSGIANYNNSYCYLLTCIDVFTREHERYHCVAKVAVM